MSKTDYNITVVNPLGTINIDKTKYNCDEYFLPSIISFESPTEGSRKVYIYKYPTFNCQVSSIAFSQCIFKEPDKDLKRNIFREINNITNQLVLIDVNRSYSEEILKFLGDAVLKNTPYTSSNMHEMNLILFNIRKLCEILK